MQLKTLKKISVVFLFFLSFLIHFLYDWFPNDLFAIFFPVNESIWEHMKMLYTTIIFYGVIEYFLLQKMKILINNYLLSVFLSASCSIPIYLLLFLPFYQKGLHQMWFYLFIMIITYIICAWISYFIMKLNKIKYQNVVAIFLIILFFVGFGYLTYHPLKTDLFFDSKEEKYGIHDYII